MDNLPVSGPITPYDWLALKDQWGQNFSVPDLIDLAVIYGLCCLPPFEDKAYCEAVNAYLDVQEEPVRARFEFSHYLASSFWEVFTHWRWSKFKLPDGTEFEPEWPQELKGRIMADLLAGIRDYRGDRELMQLVHWLKYRRGMDDTSLEDEEIVILEQALGYEIDPAKDKYVQELMETMREQYYKDFLGKEAPDKDE